MLRKNSIVTLPPDVLSNLESDLNKTTFHNLPLGSALNDILRIDAMEGKYVYGLISCILDALKRVKYFIKSSKSCDNTYLPHREYLITSIGAKPSLIEMVIPLVKKLGPERCFVLSANDGIKNLMPAGAVVVNVNDLGYGGNVSWRNEYRQMERQWVKVIKQYVAKHKLPQSILSHLIVNFLVQARRVMVYENLLSAVKPYAVVTEYDRSFMAAPLILTANKVGIKTFTMVHGMINEYGYTPILANKIFCWGQQHREQLLGKGVPDEKLAITGNPRFMQNNKCNPAEVKKKAGLVNGKPVVVLASSNITTAYKKQLARNFCLAFKDSPNVTAMIRLHPNEKLFDFQEEIEDFPMIIFSQSGDLTTDEIISITDVFVVHNSGLGNDALIQNKIVVVYDGLPLELGNGRVVHTKAGMPLVKTSEELRKIVEYILNNAEYNNKLIKAASIYKRYICSYFGDDAVDETITQIKTQ